MDKKHLKKLLLFIIIFFSIIIIDQSTKYLVSKNMYLYQSNNVIKDWIRITYIENTGFLNGLGSHLNDGTTFNPIVLITIGALLIVIAYFIYLIIYTKTNTYLVLTFSILLGGAFGNFIDRLIRKKVIDFIEFKFFHLSIGKLKINSFPVFNFADFFVTTGIIMLIIYFIFLEKKYLKEIKKENNYLENNDFEQEQFFNDGLEDKSISEEDEQKNIIDNDDDL